MKLLSRAWKPQWLISQNWNGHTTHHTLCLEDEFQRFLCSEKQVVSRCIAIVILERVVCQNFHPLSCNIRIIRDSLFFFSNTIKYHFIWQHNPFERVIKVTRSRYLVSNIIFPILSALIAFCPTNPCRLSITRISGVHRFALWINSVGLRYILKALVLDKHKRT